MTKKKLYPAILVKDAKKAIAAGSRLELEIVDSEGKQGFAWRPYLIDEDGDKFIIVKTDLAPKDILYSSSLISFGQELGLTHFDRLPVPDVEKYRVRG